jgi:hypothetical protein
MSNLLIDYRDKDLRSHTIQIQTDSFLEDKNTLEKLINKKRKKHRPIKIYKTMEVQ